MSARPNRRPTRRSSQARLASRRVLRMERLCDRRVLATISGMVFEDANQSQRQDADESGLEDRIVYLDLNQDGAPNLGEPLQRTDDGGGFQFSGLAPGEYVVRLFNGTQSQRQTSPVFGRLDDNLIQVSDVALRAANDDGSAVYGLVEQSLVRIDPASGETTTIPLGGKGASIHPLPDGTLLVLADTTDPPATPAWIVSFENNSAAAIDLGLGEDEIGWASAAINQHGEGVLVGQDAVGGRTVLRTLAFEDDRLIATPTTSELEAGSHVITNWQSPLSLFAIPGEDGLQLIQWSNATRMPIEGGTGTVPDGTRLEAFDEAASLAVVRDAAGDLLVLDVANSYALLARVPDLPGEVTIDGLRQLLYGRDADSNLVIYDFATQETAATVSVSLPRVGDMFLLDEGRSLIMGGDYAVLRAELDVPTGHRVELDSEQASADVLFGLFVQPENTPPVFVSSPSLTTAEDTPLTRPAPHLLVHGGDPDPGDRVIVLRGGTPNLGSADVGPDGSFRYLPNQDVFGRDAFEILLHDGRSASEPTDLEVNITPVDDPLGPWVVDLPEIIPENLVGPVAIGPVTVINVDVGEEVIFEVDDPRFKIEDGQLILLEGVELDFETEQAIYLTLIAYVAYPDAPPEGIETSVLLQVSDSNDAVTGVVLHSPTPIYEHAPGVTIVGSVSAEDEDASGDYEFSVDDYRFEVVDGYLQLKAEQELDYETDRDLEITITVTDGPFEASSEFVIEVIDINEPMTSIEFAADSVTERVEGAVVGEMHVEDPDLTPTARLSVDDGRFEFVGTTLKLRDGVSVSVSEQQQIHLILTAHDQSDPPATLSLPVTLNVTENPLPFHNPVEPLDVDGIDGIAPRDVLLIINYLNQHGPGPIEKPNVSGAPVYYDVNGDGWVTPLDALLVINRLNLDGRSEGQVSAEGEDESPQGEAIAGPSNPSNGFGAGAESPALVTHRTERGSASGFRGDALSAAIPPAAIDRAVSSFFADDEDEDDEPQF
ncbi:dockerin type I domain-containing protein [Roseimaritima sediminicola]|uniref:dockerin type I domain-containing protein n=1 Tax=Roseimaritima sediminicola TaxID=2662066 RepID=UPI00129848F2|nr:dockerin type I domain-containing protein [Roseimaritima sediminicola]